MECLKTITKGNYCIEICQDNYAESPRNFEEPLSRLITWHKRYTFGGRTDEDFMEQYFMDIDGEEVKLKDITGHRSSMDDIQEDLLTVFGKKTIVYKVYLYDHSSLALSLTPFSCKWDSGCLGFILITEEGIKKEYGDLSEESLKKADKVLKAEFETFKSYIEGEVYSFSIFELKKCNLGHIHKEVIDSYGGYYGSKNLFKDIYDSISEECKELFKEELLKGEN